MINIYIQLESGLEKIINDITSSQIIEALGYIPASKNELNNILNSDSDVFYIVDDNSNIIAKIDSLGIHTTEVEVGGFKVKKHIENKDNPHEVTKAQIGLGNVDNTADRNKPVSNAVRNELNIVNQNVSNQITQIRNEIGSGLLSSNEATLKVIDNNGLVAVQIGNDGLKASKLWVKNYEINPWVLHRLSLNSGAYELNIYSQKTEDYTLEELQTDIGVSGLAISLSKLDGTNLILYNKIYLKDSKLYLSGFKSNGGSWSGIELEITTISDAIAATTSIIA